jgi:transcriptional regulator with XRE-family HTH domain
MSNLYERIHDLCEEKGIKGAKLCTDTGISKGLLTDLKKGRRTGVSAVTAQKIAAYFGVSVGYLLGEEEKINADPIGTAEKHFEILTDEMFVEIYEDFKILDAEQKQLVKEVVRAFAEKKRTEA